MTTTIKLSSTQKKYIAILESGKITESELISLNSFYNKDKENQSFINDLMFNEGHEELTLTDEQNQKGYDFLMALRFTPTGKDRLNSPYGYREENILDNFSHFTFCGFYSDMELIILECTIAILRMATAFNITTMVK